MRAEVGLFLGVILAGCASEDDAAVSDLSVEEAGSFDVAVVSLAHADADAHADLDAGADRDAGTTAFRHRRCGWLYQGDETGKAAFLANVDYFDVIHPTGWILDPTDAFTATALPGVPDPVVIAAAKAHGVAVWPMIASGDSSAGVDAEETMWSDPTLRARHVASIVDMVVDGGYAGVDVDYEHMPTGDGPDFVRFLVELSSALHAQGKKVSVASGALWTTPTGDTPWDYPTFATHLDAVHLMAYDFHRPCCTHPGQIAPLGWVRDVCAHVAEVAGPNVGKFILGLPNYGYDCGKSKDCAASCASPISITTDELATCFLNDNDWFSGRAPNCTRSDGSLTFFEDTPSLEEKVANAKDHHLGGVTEWTIGNEPDGFFAMVKRYY